jgi:phenylacetate-coenzyme A ligase PaaK-like adenylate-forming protein
MASVDVWNRCANLVQLWWTRHGGVPAADLAAHRLAALVRFVRERSPYYRRLYADLPAGEAVLARLPPTRKTELMAHFDDWVTDRRIRRADVERFVATRPVGERFLGDYVAWQSSGSTGTPGLFVQDRHALAVYDALVAQQFNEAWWGPAAAALAATGARAALVAATHGHFASVVSWEQSRRVQGEKRARCFSVMQPLPKLVAALEAWRPSFLASYPSVLAMLANERLAGRLRVRPAALWSGGEFLAPRVRAHIERAFEAPLLNEYGASECLSIAGSCSAGALHVHADWALLEPVDAQMRPVPAGVMSHTVLLTNLANWVQPIIRYDLGDRMALAAQPCPCGNPMPAMFVEGRTDDTLQMRSSQGRVVPLPPLAIATVVEDAAQVHRFQLVQTAPDALALRLPPGAATRAATWKRARPAMRAYLAEQGLANVRVALDRASPRADAASGKLRTVVALAE